MLRSGTSVAMVLMLAAGAAAAADEGAEWRAGGSHFADRETLTDSWLGLGKTLEERGVTISLGLTQVYQVNLRGGMSVSRKTGRCAGSYDLEGEFDMEKLAGLSGGLLYALAEGSWTEGLDESSIGSVMGVNDDAGGNRSIDLTELWYQQNLLGDRLRIRAGKIDLTGGFECRGSAAAFDGSAYANDETTQFLNGGLVNNASIPFPDNGLGIATYFEPAEGFYLAAGAADAAADARETGFRTAFHGPSDFFYIFETGVVHHHPCPCGPMPGAYRVGLWYDPQPKERFANGRTKTDDVGFYVSLDQKVYKECADDDQGLGLFTRYGYADGDVNEIQCFWSAGAEYVGLVPGRDEDVAGMGFAIARLSADNSETVEDREAVMELYYSLRLTGWLAVTPSLQYVWNPGGVNGTGDACVLGLRLQAAF